MANTKSAKKAIRVAERRRRRNLPIRTGVKTAFRKARVAIEQSGGETPEFAAVHAQSTIDKAVSKGVVHWRTAARKKSRLMKKLNQAASANQV